MKKLTILAAALALSLTAAGCGSKDEPAPAPEKDKGTNQSAPGSKEDGFAAAPDGTDTGSWDAEKYPERVGVASKEFLLSTEYGVWEAGKSWYITGGTWDPGADISISISTAPEGNVDAGSLAGFASEEAGAPFFVKAAEDGTFEAAVAVPEDTKPGNYVITATDEKADIEQGQILQVVAPE